MHPDADSYRALARSSPWRWRTLHFTRRPGASENGRKVEAWLRRPADLLVRPAGLPEQYVHGVPYSTSRVLVASGLGTGALDLAGDGDNDGGPAAHDAPVFRADGLVARRPRDWYLEHGDPMWENYTWTAMLDPDELSHDVEVDDVRSGQVHGRDVWWATLRPLEGYDPRCGCCPLLWSEVAARAEYGDEPERLARFAADGYPVAHDVALDVETGVVVVLEPKGAPYSGARFPGGFSVEIHAVDADLDALFPTRPAVT